MESSEGWSPWSISSAGERWTIHLLILFTSTIEMKWNRCSSVTRRLTKQDKIGYRLDIRLDIRLCLYIDTHSRLSIITTCFVQLPACLLVAIPNSHHSHCRIGLLHRDLFLPKRYIAIGVYAWFSTNTKPETLAWQTYLYCWNLLLENPWCSTNISQENCLADRT